MQFLSLFMAMMLSLSAVGSSFTLSVDEYPCCAKGGVEQMRSDAHSCCGDSKEGMASSEEKDVPSDEKSCDCPPMKCLKCCMKFLDHQQGRFS